MCVGAVASAHETIKLPWKEATAWLIACSLNEPISAKCLSLLSEPLYDYQRARSALHLFCLTLQHCSKKTQTPWRSQCLTRRLLSGWGRELKNTKGADSPHLPPVPNPSTPESLLAAPSSGLRSKWERMAHRSAQRGAGLLWAHRVLGPKSFHAPDRFTENRSSALRPVNERYLGSEIFLRRCIKTIQLSPFCSYSWKELEVGSVHICCAVDVFILTLQRFISFLEAAETPASSPL